MIKNLGIRGLYTGFWSSTVWSVPSHGVYYLTYNYCKDKLQDIDNKMKKETMVKGKQAMWVSFTAGGLADIASNIFSVPIDVVVQRLQIQDKNSVQKYKGAVGKC